MINLSMYLHLLPVSFKSILTSEPLTPKNKTDIVDLPYLLGMLQYYPRTQGHT